MIDLGVSKEDAKKYTRSSHKNVEVKCPDCGREKKIAICDISRRKTISCQCIDGVSYPEKFLYSTLSQLNVSFETQYSPEYLFRKETSRNTRSDFYLEDYNLVIEVDGKIGHKGGEVHSKSNKNLETLIAIDKWKDGQHLKHGVKTIRINCFESDIEYIKNSILNSDLRNIFDLSKVDWLKCEEFALKNIVKEVCDYWNNKEEWETTQTIANNNKWGIKSKTTIYRFLKKGVSLSWCKYNSEEESKKVALKLFQLNAKRVAIYKDNLCLGVFNSTYELERKSEELFGVKLLNPKISEICLGRRNKYKGYTFKYI